MDMSADGWANAYQLINALVVPGWALLIFLPRSKLTSALVHSMVYPALMGTIYVAALGAGIFLGQSADGAGFSSIDGVAAIFDHPNGIIIGWTHYLVFDLFVGAWIGRDAIRRNLPHLMIIPCLLGTFMFGPVGLLGYLLLRLVLRKKFSLREDQADELRRGPPEPQRKWGDIGMTRTLGALLDDFNDFHAWLAHSQASIWVLHAVSRSQVLDHLGDEPTPMEILAARAGMKTDMLRRVMNFLASQEVIEIDAKDRVIHTARSRAFRDRQEVVRWLAVNFPPGLKLDQAMKTGTASFELHYDQPIFDYLSERPDLADEFGKLMSSITNAFETFIFSQHQFKPFTRAIDIGGSHGRLMTRLLTEYPSATGVIFDLPGTAAAAEKHLASSALKDRIEIVGGDFFKAVPEGGDLYLMKQILHDWGDEECAAILKNIRAAIADNGRLAIIDFLLPEEPAPHPGYALDINMMNLLNGGRERRLSEFEEIFAKAGFALDRVTENPNGQSLFEAVPV